MRKKMNWLFILILSWVLLAPLAAWAQTAGKIAGRITDASTGEPLPGANIVVKGTRLGAAADMNGDFYILNLPPGSYTLEVRMIGYINIVMEEIRVSVNRTAQIELKMKATVIEGETVTVSADRIAIKKDQTNSIRNISSDDIEMLPVENVYSIVAMQPGVSENHFRGGRSNEVTYMIDGMKVTESFRHESSTFEVNPDAVEDIEVITGTFNAEYGDAMSGIVNIVTKEGGSKFEGNIATLMGNYLTPHDDKFAGLSSSEFDRIQDYKFNLSGPILGDKLTFLLDGRSVSNLGYLNGVHYFDVHDFSDYTSADSTMWHTEHSGDSSFVPMSKGKDLMIFGKLTYKPFTNLKMSLSSGWNDREHKYYSHANRFNPFGLPTYYNESIMWTYHLNHMLSRAAYYDLKLSLSDYYTGGYMYKDPQDSRYINDEYNRSNGFSTGGQDKNHTERWEKNLNLKWDFSWQLSKAHFLKTGIDLSQITLKQQYSSIQNGLKGTGLEYNWIQDPYTGDRIYTNYTPLIYSDASPYSDIYKHKPIKLSYYLQDKMEFESMVVNLGVRFDYFDPDAVYPTNYRNPNNEILQVDASRYSTYPKADPQTQVSPRLGLSYQLGQSALLRFSYGHFQQLPPLDYYYQNNSFNVTIPEFSSRIGNANLKAQKTIQYEVGLWQQLTRNMNLEVAVYYRDIYDLVTATIYTTYNQIRYGVYSNLEYGNARGLEVKYEFRQDDLSAGVNYTLGYTRGIANSPEMTFDRAGQKQDPVNKLIPMEWDQRHTFNTYVGYNTRKYGTTIMLYYYSGTTYTWSPIAQSPMARINLFPNNQHKPARYNVDVTAFYNLFKVAGMKFQLNLMVYNLLDRLNEVGVNGNTGRAYQAIITESDLIAFRSDYSEFIDTVHNPGMFSSPREVKLGLSITF